MLTYVDLIANGAARFGPRTAVMFGAEKLTYRDVDRTSNQMANTLIHLGIGQGEGVGILAGNGLWTIPVDFACAKAGVVRVPLNDRLSPLEHKNMLEGTGTRILVYALELKERAHALADVIDGLKLVSIGADPDADAFDLLGANMSASDKHPGLKIAPSDPLLWLHTSGTTGSLKAAEHTQSSFAEVVPNILGNLVSPEPDSIILHAAPLIHGSGTFVLPYWVRGAAAAVLPGFEPEEYMRAIEHYRPTELNIVPTMMAMLLASGAAHRHDASSLRSVAYGASPMPRPVLEEGMELWGPKFVQYYGQTESPLCLTVLSRDDHKDPDLLGACGHPIIGVEVAVTDDDGVPVATGEIGEVRAWSRTNMARYHNAPELTAETLTADGWVRTRDMAVVDDRGYLHLVDRRSDMIVTGGYNVYPREVEDALMCHPGVAEAAVVAAPDDTWVEAVTAYISLKPGVVVSQEEIQTVVRDRLAAYKVPKAVHVVDVLPKSPVGKILRRALRDPLWEGRAQNR